MGNPNSLRKYAFTVSLRRDFRKAELYLKKINYESFDSYLVWKLGMNLLWIELHVITFHDLKDSNNNGGIEINLSLPLSESFSVSCFKPQIDKFSTVVQGTHFDEKAALKKMKLQREQSLGLEKDKLEPFESLQLPAVMIEDDLKMIGTL